LLQFVQARELEDETVLARFVGERLVGPAIDLLLDLGHVTRRALAMARTLRPLTLADNVVVAHSGNIPPASVVREGSMSSQRGSTRQDNAKLVWCAVAAAWFAGFLCATAIWQVLMDLKLGPGHGHFLPWWVRGVIGLFIAVVLTLLAYFLTSAALNSRE
jgi:fatty acid desaturase